MDGQHVKESETLRKRARQFFFQIFSSLRKKMSSKNSFLVVSEILRLFVNILTHDDMYSPSVKASASQNHFKWNYLEIVKYLLNFFLHFPNVHKILNSWKQKISLRGDFFLKL